MKKLFCVFVVLFGLTACAYLSDNIRCRIEGDPFACIRIVIQTQSAQEE